MWRVIIFFLILFSSRVFSQVSDTIINGADGITYYKGKIDNGVFVGVWIEYDTLNNRLNTIEMLPDGKNCKVIPSFLGSGDSCFIEAYFIGSDIIYNGVYIVCFNAKNLKQYGAFKEGKKNGQWRYYVNNILRTIEYYSLNEGKSIILFSESGALLNYYQTNLSHVQNGFCMEIDSIGNPRSFGNFKDDFKIGEWSYFYPNGSIKSRGVHFPDYLQLISKGDAFILVNKDSINANTIYPIDVLDLFNINDQILYLKEGCWEYFNIDGSLQRIEFYVNGELKKVKKLK